MRLRMVILIGTVLSLQSCRVTQRQELDGDVEAKVIVEFPQAQACFNDPRIETFEQLEKCLELVTNNRWTVTVDGEITPLLEGVASQAAE